VPRLSWAVLLTSYRKAHQLTQEDLAQVLNVTTATVSRWESGRQTPGIMHAARLEALIGLHRLNQTEEWFFRVNQSAACKTLVGRDGVVAAVSDPFLAEFGWSRADVIGRSLWDHLGRDVERAAQSVLILEAGPKGGVGFFGGRIRQIKFVADRKTSELAKGPSRWAVDIWPLLTAQDHLYAHVTASPMGQAPDGVCDGHFRLVSFRLTQIARPEGFDSTP
jgi:transcriptional regulator with XRE-family HTH domain